MTRLRTIDLAKGWPSPSLLPATLLGEATSRVLSNPDLSTPALLYGPDPGYRPLREEVAAWLAEGVGSDWTTADNICISGGASQNLACILQVFSDPYLTKHVYMVAPTYHLACRIFEDNGFAGRLRAVPEDDEGIDIAYLETRLSEEEQQNGRRDHQPTKYPQRSQKTYRNIVYCVPTFSNPSGKTMSLSRRQQLVRLARQHNALIIADDVYDLLTWSSKPVPPKIVDVDQALDGGPSSAWGNAVSNSSFSKILGPGVRTGWVVGTLRFIQGLSLCGSTVSGGAPSQLMAVVIAELLKKGEIQSYLKDVIIRKYRAQSQVLLAAVKRHLVPHGVTIDTDVCGGYFIYLHLPISLSARTFMNKVQQLEGVSIESGDQFEVVGDEKSVPCRDGLRICFAWEDEDHIVEGVVRIERTLRQMIGHRDSRSSSVDTLQPTSHCQNLLPAQLQHRDPSWDCSDATVLKSPRILHNFPQARYVADPVLRH